MKSLAIKYRPTDWDDVVEQDSIKTILLNQLETETFKHAYLFCGGAGTGKTTCARIFANKINNGMGNPIEMDAASNNSVDDVRNIIQQSKTKSLDSEFKIFIIDECHALSNSAWQAMLKIIEEPPAKSIFIFCTTDPQKIPKTIISRVQRYDFQRISQDGIIDRLHRILQFEGFGLDSTVEDESLEYIAKLADGGMRDAITLLDKCLSYSTDLTLENVVNALGLVDYDVMRKLTDAVMFNRQSEIISIIENIHASGKDLKQFVKSYMSFILDVTKYGIGCDWKYIQIPNTQEISDWLDNVVDYTVCFDLMDTLVKLNSDIKYSSTPKSDIVATLLLMTVGGTE